MSAEAKQQYTIRLGPLHSDQFEAWALYCGNYSRQGKFASCVVAKCLDELAGSEEEPDFGQISPIGTPAKQLGVKLGPEDTDVLTWMAGRQDMAPTTFTQNLVQALVETAADAIPQIGELVALREEYQARLFDQGE